MVQPPRRQNSTLSSISSGGRTIRAASRNKSRSSSNGSDSDDSQVIFSRRSPKPEWSGESYEDKLNDVLESGFGNGRMSAGPSTVRAASEDGMVEDEDEDEHFDYAAVKARMPSGSTYDERFRDVLDEAEQSADAVAGSSKPKEVVAVPDEMRGDEEFGEFAHSPADDRSDKTPSTSSAPSHNPWANAQSSPASQAKRPPYLHPTVSRLRSHMRHPSSSTMNSSTTAPPLGRSASTSSHFSAISRSSSTLSTALQEERSPVDTTQVPAFSLHPLRHVSATIYPATSGLRTTWGRPTVMCVQGMIAVGTEKGWVVVYGFGQELKCVCGDERIGARASGPVTAVAISPDHTYLAVGHATGNIYLYALTSPSKPARTAPALQLRSVLTGRKEGHLVNSRILHIGFVGSRHTAIVSADEHGRAFWSSLGRVLGVDSSDVVRMLGSYPPSAEAEVPPSKASTLFAASPLPLGKTQHATDTFQLAALLTPSKLVVVGLKPSARTWFRRLRGSEGGSQGGVAGCAAWLPAGSLTDSQQGVSDPVLAYSWGSAVRFLRVRVVQLDEDPATARKVEFVEGRRWDAGGVVNALQWLDSNHVVALTVNTLVLLDVRSMAVVERTPLQGSRLVAHDFHVGLARRGRVSVPDALGASVQTYRGKLFLLTDTDVQVGSLVLWADRILANVQKGDFLAAIDLAVAYYQGRAPGNAIGLPEDADRRMSVVGKRIHELLSASLRYAFSDDRMTDDTHYSADGRGVDLTSLFESLATAAIDACIAIDDIGFLFDDVYEHFASAGIHAMFLAQLEPYILDEKLRDIPPNIVQALIGIHEDRGELDEAEAVIWHVHPASLDIDQAVNLCETHGLWDALIYVYTRALRDYVAPATKLIAIVREIQRHRSQRSQLVGTSAGREDVEALVPNAYKLYEYIESVLVGLSYPSHEPMPEEEGLRARAAIYRFLFHGRSVAWPPKGDPDSKLILTADVEGEAEPSYPYLRLLLRFDAEAFLHAMDSAFEDPYLNDPGRDGSISRQLIVNLMLDVMASSEFHSTDLTFLHIFVARNLPKYPQFLLIPPSTLHRILTSLAEDPDQSTREDRQLAAEYLLSAYTPHDADAMNARFERAGFFRILRATFRREQKWVPLVDTFMHDPETDQEVFAHFDEILQQARRSSPAVLRDVLQAIIHALPLLFQLGVRQTALLLDRSLDTHHSEALEVLDGSPHKQLAYLRCLLEPSHIDEQDETGPLPARRDPASSLDMNAKLKYVSLLCKLDTTSAVPFLDARGKDFFDLDQLAQTCEAESLYEGVLWALDRQGKATETFEKVGLYLRSQGVTLAEAVVAEEGGDGAAHMALQAVQSITRMAVRISREHSTADLPSEEMWFGVLHEVVELVHTMVAVAPDYADIIPPSPSRRRYQSLGYTNGDRLDTVVIDSLRALVQETLSCLVSSSSSALSFPKLFRRLVEASASSTASSTKGQTYSEFRAILTGMLDSYKAEGELLAMTTRLVESDLFDAVEEYTAGRMGGWRAEGRGCEVCHHGLNVHGKATSAGAPCGPAVIVASGEWRHAECI